MILWIVTFHKDFDFFAISYNLAAEVWKINTLHRFESSLSMLRGWDKAESLIV